MHPELDLTPPGQSADPLAEWPADASFEDFLAGDYGPFAREVALFVKVRLDRVTEQLIAGDVDSYLRGEEVAAPWGGYAYDLIDWSILWGDPLFLSLNEAESLLPRADPLAQWSGYGR